jgi:hypothetical protein
MSRHLVDLAVCVLARSPRSWVTERISLAAIWMSAGCREAARALMDHHPRVREHVALPAAPRRIIAPRIIAIPTA